MKNRTVIGIVCIVLALAVTFGVAPLVNKLADSRCEIVRMTKNVTQGHIFLKWIYEAIYGAIADFFTMMGNMGADMFNLPWVQAIVKLFGMFGWALFVAGLVVAVFDTAIEYQSMGRVNIKRQIMPVLYGFLAVNLFTTVPIELYKLCLTLQNLLSHDLSSIFAGYMITEKIREECGQTPQEFCEDFIGTDQTIGGIE